MNTKQMFVIGSFIFLIGLLIYGGQIDNTQPNVAFPDQSSPGQVESNDDTVDVIGEEPDIDVIDTKIDYTKNDFYRTSLQDLDYNYIQVLDNRIPLEIKQINLNYSVGAVMTPKYLVIHETNNYSEGADANAHYRYWSTNSTAQASTHFVVDNNEIYQMLELDQVGWHVGDNKGHSSITNFNSIGIEIAVNSDGDYMQARQNTIELTINLMNELKMDISQLKRHYDASGKWCPKNMLDEPALWTDFVAQVKAGLNQ